MNRIILAALALTLAGPVYAKPAEVVCQGNDGHELSCDSPFEYLGEHGFCSLPNGKIGYGYACDNSSKRTDELPFSPSAEAIDSELGEDQL